jgi:hypothetical protein
VHEAESLELASVLGRFGLRLDVDTAVRLPSVSNLVFRLDGMVVRLPSRARVGVDRSTEAMNMQRAHDLGLAPPVVAWDTDGSLVTKLLPGQALRPVDGAHHTSEVATLLRSLHRSPAFAGRHDPWRMSAELSSLGATDASCDQVADALEPLRFDPVALAPCHGDPWPGNIIEFGRRCTLVDWEYSGMGDPLWDLADYAVECELDEGTRRHLRRITSCVPRTTPQFEESASIEGCRICSGRAGVLRRNTKGTRPTTSPRRRSVVVSVGWPPSRCCSHWGACNQKSDVKHAADGRSAASACSSLPNAVVSGGKGSAGGAR